MGITLRNTPNKTLVTQQNCVEDLERDVTADCGIVNVYENKSPRQKMRKRFDSFVN